MSNFYAIMLLAIAGYPGTGKTTLAKRLEQEMTYFRLTRDDIIQVLFRHFDFGSLEQKAAVYQRMLSHAEIALNTGRNVVLDMPFTRNEEIELAQSLASRLNVQFKVVYLECPEHIRIERVYSQTDHPVSVALRSQPRTSNVPAGCKVIDTTLPIEVCVAECLDYLRS